MRDLIILASMRRRCGPQFRLRDPFGGEEARHIVLPSGLVSLVPWASLVRHPVLNGTCRMLGQLREGQREGLVHACMAGATCKCGKLPSSLLIPTEGVTVRRAALARLLAAAAAATPPPS